MGRAIAIGKFDALHLGHRALIDAAQQYGKPCILQFSGMAEVLGWTERPALVAEAERARILKSWANDVELLEIPFAEVRNLGPSAFIEYLQAAYPFSAIITGDNFKFGYQRSGDVDTLKQLGADYSFQTHAVAAVRHAGQVISSSRIREAVCSGYVQVVNEMLGRPYLISGQVVHGEKRGRQIGFPTANVQGIKNVIPATGVYAVRVSINNGPLLPAALNIGHLPSIADERPLSVEAHILDYNDDCYDQNIRIELIERIREEKKFDGLDALKEQIARDVKRCREILV